MERRKERRNKEGKKRVKLNLKSRDLQSYFLKSLIFPCAWQLSFFPSPFTLSQICPTSRSLPFSLCCFSHSFLSSFPLFSFFTHFYSSFSFLPSLSCFLLFCISSLTFSPYSFSLLNVFHPPSFPSLYFLLTFLSSALPRSPQFCPFSLNLFTCSPPQICSPPSFLIPLPFQGTW